MIHRAMGFIVLIAPLLGGMVGCAASRSHTVRSSSRSEKLGIDRADRRLLSIAKGYERRGNFAKARQLYETVLARHPGQSAARRGLGVVAAREKARRALDQSAIVKRQDRSSHGSKVTVARVQVARVQVARVHDSKDPAPQQQPTDRPVAAPHPSISHPSTPAIITADNTSVEPSLPIDAPAGHRHTVASLPMVTQIDPKATETTEVEPKQETEQPAAFPETVDHFVLPKRKPFPQSVSEADPFADPRKIQSIDGQKTIHLQQQSNAPRTTVIEVYAENPDRAVPQLIGLIDDDSDSNRSLAAYLLGQAGPAATPALPILRQRLGDESNDLVRVYVAEALVKIDPEDQSGLRALLHGLNNDTAAVRLISACALSSAAGGRHETQVVQALATSLYDTASDVRSMAALSLGEIGPAASGAVPNLTTALGDKQLKVREAAVSALACITQLTSNESTGRTTQHKTGRTTESSAPPMPQ